MRVKHQQTSFIRLLIVMVILLMIGGCLIGCNNAKEKETIETVLHAMLTYPNKNYDTLMESMETEERLNQTVDEIYGEYFTKEALEAFKNARYPLIFLTPAAENGYEMKLDRVELKQEKEDAETWIFTVSICIKEESETEEIKTENGAVRFVSGSQMEYFTISSNYL